MEWSATEAASPGPIASGLSLLSEIERRYDGPYPLDATLQPAEIAERQAAEARTASCFHADRARRSLRFARRHLAQGRPDLAALMLDDARIERSRWRHWRQRDRSFRED